MLNLLSHDLLIRSSLCIAVSLLIVSFYNSGAQGVLLQNLLKPFVLPTLKIFSFFLFRI